MGGLTAPVSSSGSPPAWTTRVANASTPGVPSRRGLPSGTPSASQPRVMAQVFQHVELRDHPDGPLPADREDRGDPSGQERERLVERGGLLDHRERRVHDLAHRPLHHGRVPVCALEEALLRDRADDPGQLAAVGRLRDRHLADPVILEPADRGPHLLGGPGQDQVRDLLPVRVIRRAIANASRSDTRTQRSTSSESNVPGMKSSPTPSVRYGRATSPERMLPSGSAPTTTRSGLCVRRYRAAPVIVPPVPTDATRCVILPAVCLQISGPVVASWASVFSTFQYWSGL